MVVIFTTTCVISAYHYLSSEFEPCSWRDVLDTTLCLQGDNPRYVRTNAGCKHLDVHGGPENIPVSRFSFDAKVLLKPLIFISV
jgi:hypothetical protein